MVVSGSAIGFLCLSFATYALEGASAEDIASTYLSDHSFPGLHILELRSDSALIHQNGQAAKDIGVAPLEVKTSAWHSMEAARQALEVALSIPPPEPLQLPWALFDAQGTRLENVEQLLNLKVAFLIIVGQWMWPAVRIGFEQEARGVLNGDAITLRTLSLRPVVFEVHGFILPDETDAVIGVGAKRNMVNSAGTLTSADAGKQRAHSEYRTSTQAWLQRGDDKVIAHLDDRTSNLTRVPIDNNEDVQLLRYGQGQFYSAHLDWSDLTLYNGQQQHWQGKHYGWRQRMATLFWYLNDVDSGGQTVFPKHGQPICPGIARHCEGSWQPDPKRCDVGLQVTPKRGSVILWYNLHADGRGDQNALHGGCPPAEGYTKWSGNKWISSKSLKLPSAPWMPDHPGLKRFGWKKANIKDPNSCELTVVSRHSDVADLMWIKPNTEERIKLGTIIPKQTSSQQSFKGHEFVVKAGGIESAIFRCNGGKSSYAFDAGMQIDDLEKPEL